jgi:hypothetical protein
MSTAPSLTGSVRVTLPLKTVSVLNGSQGFSRGAAMAAARRRKDQRSLAAHVVGMHLHACRVTLPVVVTLVRLAPSSGLDDDNIRGALKSVRDGVADALGVDDRDPDVSWVYEQRRTQRRKTGAVELGTVRGYGVEVRVEARR